MSPQYLKRCTRILDKASFRDKSLKARAARSMSVAAVKSAPTTHPRSVVQIKGCCKHSRSLGPPPLLNACTQGLVRDKLAYGRGLRFESAADWRRRARSTLGARSQGEAWTLRLWLHPDTALLLRSRYHIRRLLQRKRVRKWRRCHLCKLHVLRRASRKGGGHRSVHPAHLGADCTGFEALSQKGWRTCYGQLWHVLRHRHRWLACCSCGAILQSP